MEKAAGGSFFSVSVDMIVTDKPTLYNLYINAANDAAKEKFVRIFPIGGTLTKDKLDGFKKKYHQLYVPEEQRNLFLQSLVTSSHISDEEKTVVIKDSAIKHLSKLFDQGHEFTTEVLNETISECKETVVAMVDVVKNYNIKELQQHIAKLSFHDFYTYDHSINVSMYCIVIYKMLRPEADKQELVNAGLGGLLHDIGKIQIPTSILNKPGKLSDEEFHMIQAHPDTGKEILNNKEVHVDQDVNLEVIKRVVNEHHENYNGTGYPKKLSAKDIHLLARITAIADFFDAITTKRAYHEVLSMEEAVEVMRNTKGKKLDPDLFEFFAKHVGQVARNKKINNYKIPDDFDPCMPHEKLPTIKMDPKSLDLEDQSKPDGFGKIVFKQFPKLKRK